MKFFQIVFALLLVGLFAVGCSEENQASTSTDESDLTIYTTIYPLQYAIEQIGGGTVNVESVYPAGADAHTYEPTSKDMTAIAESDAFIYLGAGMEAFAETVGDALSSQDVSLMEIGEHEELFTAYEDEHVHEHEEEEVHTHESHDHESHDEEGNGGHEDEKQDEHAGHSHDGHNHGDHDPHFWFDPLRMIEAAEIIKDELIALNPSKEADYNENFESLRSNLIELDDQYTEILGEKENKQVLVSHAAFGYWEERYDIEQIAVNGLSTENEPSQKELIEIIDQVEENNLKYILFEQNSSNRVTKVIQEEVGLEPLTIHTLEVLSEEDITNNKDYLSLMNDNLEVLDQATK
ncbi:zinc transport system substrate-binding protein [Virgibacillus natechei]|uniref:Zinc transport system substrate-binding protein n=1 Tax=Virgibacillus natechei TaxID=1216297 RepID=A0ABS4IJM6_9BACI|nr:zinc ABC transporter substrate-binding protein [Virgibacillus natechei]MBP1971078.1 zinc transport system substrate-binding protein [Virgibacillus natechei]UZD13021.1 zinc ABC transporter substrate-binding protein [Virgibacillus natechei]